MFMLFAKESLQAVPFVRPVDRLDAVAYDLRMPSRSDYIRRFSRICLWTSPKPTKCPRSKIPIYRGRWPGSGEIGFGVFAIRRPCIRTLAECEPGTGTGGPGAGDGRDVSSVR